MAQVGGKAAARATIPFFLPSFFFRKKKRLPAFGDVVDDLFGGVESGKADAVGASGFHIGAGHEGCGACRLAFGEGLQVAGDDDGIFDGDADLPFGGDKILVVVGTAPSGFAEFDVGDAGVEDAVGVAFAPELQRTILLGNFPGCL